LDLSHGCQSIWIVVNDLSMSLLQYCLVEPTRLAPLHDLLMLHGCQFVADHSLVQVGIELVSIRI
jgi:hypothetical protein